MYKRISHTTVEKALLKDPIVKNELDRLMANFDNDKKQIKAMRVPNNGTLKTFTDTDAGKNLVRSKDAKNMFKKLGI